MQAQTEIYTSLFIWIMNSHWYLQFQSNTTKLFSTFFLLIFVIPFATARKLAPIFFNWFMWSNSLIWRPLLLPVWIRFSLCSGLAFPHQAATTHGCATHHKRAPKLNIPLPSILLVTIPSSAESNDWYYSLRCILWYHMLYFIFCILFGFTDQWFKAALSKYIRKELETLWYKVT